MDQNLLLLIPRHHCYRDSVAHFNVMGEYTNARKAKRQAMQCMHIKDCTGILYIIQLLARSKWQSMRPINGKVNKQSRKSSNGSPVRA